MKNMFRILSVMFVIAALLAFLGCSNFLSKQPAGVQTSSAFFKTQDQANSALTAAYGAIAFQYSLDNSNWFNQWMIGDIVSDDATKGGQGPADIADLQSLRNFNATTQNSIITSQYQVPYVGIFRANTVIDNVGDTNVLPRAAIGDSLRARYVGEAKFLRAWSYFILVKSFGGVPLVLHALSNTGVYCQPRATKDAVWAQIDSDLTQAAAVLPEKSQYDLTVDGGRATKGAANSLLAKAYLYQGNFVQAEAVASTVINSNEYILEGNYADNFSSGHEEGVESVFELEYTIDPADSWSNTNQGQLFSVFQGGRDDLYFPGWGFDVPTDNLISEFETGDPRLKATVIMPGDTLYGGARVVGDTAVDVATDRSVRKYLLENQESNGGVPDMADAPAHWHAIRYSDVLLFHAEAANENGDAAAALVSLNKVRSRVHLAAVTTTDKASLRAAIYHERRVELACEGQRFWDVVRQGRGPAVFGSSDPTAPISGFVTGKNEVFAIPQIEIDVCGKLIQNQGY
jgi:hypothetical protein